MSQLPPCPPSLLNHAAGAVPYYFLVAADAKVLTQYAHLAAACAPQDAASLAKQLPAPANKLSAAQLDALENASIGGPLWCLYNTKGREIETDSCLFGVVSLWVRLGAAFLINHFMAAQRMPVLAPCSGDQRAAGGSSSGT